MFTFLFKNPSIIIRVIIGKIIGLVIGIMAATSLASFMSDLSMMFQMGIVLWYITLGAIVGIFGASSTNLEFNFSMSSWLRSFIIGAWMHFVLTFFMYDQLHNFIITTFGKNAFIQSPFWFAFQGGFIGVIMSYFVIALEEGRWPKYWYNKSR